MNSGDLKAVHQTKPLPFTMNDTRLLDSDTLPEDLTLPVFLLIRKTPGKAHNPEDGTLGGHFVAVSESRDELSIMVPKPRYPADPVFQKRVHQYFRNKEEECPELEPGMVIPEVDFDTVPHHLHWITSRSANMLDEEIYMREDEIFGESYSIVWLCSPEPSATVDFLMRKAKNWVDEDVRRGVREPRCDSENLRRLMDDYVAVIKIAPMKGVDLNLERPKEMSSEIFCQINEGFKKALSSVPWGPTELDWEELEELEEERGE